MAKQFNNWYVGFGNSIQEKNFPDFLNAFKLFTILAVIYIVLAVYKSYVNQVLQIRWRKSMTDFFVERWLAPAQHYRMRHADRTRPTTPTSASPKTCIRVRRPDLGARHWLLRQRRCGSASFCLCLWTPLHDRFPMTTFGFSFNIPGYLIWIAILYAAAGTVLITHLIGRPLISSEVYHQERYEANFRFAMARIRETQRADCASACAERAEQRRPSATDTRSILANVYAVIRPAEEAWLFHQLLRPVLDHLPVPAACPGLTSSARRRLGHSDADRTRPSTACRTASPGSSTPTQNARELPRHRSASHRVRGCHAAGPSRAAAESPRIELAQPLTGRLSRLRASW